MNTKEKIEREELSIKKNQEKILELKRKIKKSEDYINQMKQSAIAEMTKGLSLEELERILKTTKDENNRGEE